jgi:DNA-binding transcriptional MocR family regulator
MSGYVAMRRNWQDHDIFAGEEYSRRDAWAWLISNAAWKPTRARVKGETIEIGRGELCFALRFLAEKWGWSKSKVDRFLGVLRTEGMILTRSKTGTTAGQGTGQGQTIITICNYDAFQSPKVDQRDNDNHQTGTTPGQQRDKEEPSKPFNQEERATAGAASYEFDGAVIKLTTADFTKWQKSFSAIDLRAALQSRDDWLATEADNKAKTKWWISTSNHLAKLQQKARAVELEPDGWGVMP